MRRIIFSLALIAATGLLQAFTAPFVVTVNYTFTPLHTYFMSPTGSDSNNGLTTTTAWATPNHSVVCGDVIIAQTGAYAPFATNFGHVSGCPSASGGIDGAGGIYFATVLCAGASVGDCSIAVSSFQTVIDLQRDYWAIEGFKITGGSSQSIAFLAHGPIGGPDGNTVHHIAFINDITASVGAGFGTGDDGTAHTVGTGNGNGVDEFAVVGTIAYNSANWQQCVAAIDDPGPAPFDTNAGTHVIFLGNFSINSQQVYGCTATAGSDGESMMFDTWEAHGYSGQGVILNNLMYVSERIGIQAFWQNSASGSFTPGAMRIVNNTIYDVSQNANDVTVTQYGNIQVGGAAAVFPWPTYVYNNIALTQGATNASGSNLYAGQFWVSNSGTANPNVHIGASGSENILKGFVAACDNWGVCDSTNSLIVDAPTGGLGTNIYVNPTFKNTSDLTTNHVSTAPNCSGFSSTTACMGWNSATQTTTALSVIDDLIATCGSCSGKGYQPPSKCVTSGELYNDYPTWLKGVVYLKASGFVNGATITENSDLVTKPCGM